MATYRRRGKFIFNTNIFAAPNDTATDSSTVIVKSRRLQKIEGFPITFMVLFLVT